MGIMTESPIFQLSVFLQILLKKSYGSRRCQIIVSFRNRKFVCASHFEYPVNPTAIFEDVAKSDLKLTTSSAQCSNNALSSSCGNSQKKLEEEMDKIGTFQEFVNKVANRFKGFNILHNGADLTDNYG